MDATIRSALLRATSDTLEQLGFLFAEDEPAGAQAEAEAAASCRVRFRGPVSGALEVAVFGPVLDELTANMLGDDTA